MKTPVFTVFYIYFSPSSAKEIRTSKGFFCLQSDQRKLDRYIDCRWERTELLPSYAKSATVTTKTTSLKRSRHEISQLNLTSSLPAGDWTAQIRWNLCVWTTEDSLPYLDKLKNSLLKWEEEVNNPNVNRQKINMQFENDHRYKIPDRLLNKYWQRHHRLYNIHTRNVIAHSIYKWQGCLHGVKVHC